MTSPLVSAYIPAYNAEPYLAEAIRSVLDQTLGDIELIAVNDGSTDGTPGIIQAMAKADPRVRVIDQANQGVCVASNNAIRAARSNLIARMDADDVSLPDRLEKQYRYMTEHPDCLVLSGAVLNADLALCPIEPSRPPLDHHAIEAGLFSGVVGTLCNGCSMLRRDAFLEVGGFNPAYARAEELDLFLRMAERGRLANLPDTLYIVRHHLQSMSRSETLQTLRDLKYTILRETCERRGIDPESIEMAHPGGVLETYQVHIGWSSRALASGYRRTALRHALLAVGRGPLRRGAWGVLLGAVCGRRIMHAVRGAVRSVMGKSGGAAS